MDDRCKLYENDREWRRYLIEQFEGLQKKVDGLQKESAANGLDIAGMKVWNLVFRMTGGALFAIILIWLEKVIDAH